MLKLEAEEVGDDDYRKKLLAAAKLLADATAKMVEAAKVGSSIMWWHKIKGTVAMFLWD